MEDHSHDHAYLHAHGIAHSHGHVHENQKAVLNRLARAAGHLEKVRRMVEEGHDCSEVLVQLAAVRSALQHRQGDSQRPPAPLRGRCRRRRRPKRRRRPVRRGGQVHEISGESPLTMRTVAFYYSLLP